MKTMFIATNPEDMVYKLTVTMSLKDWELMRDNMSTHWPNG